MDIVIIPCLSDNYAYLLVGRAGRTIVVDPSEAAPVRAELAQRGLSLVGIWATHHHGDHVGGIPELLQSFPGIDVLGSAYDAARQRIPGLTRALAESDSLSFEGARVQLVFVPGHTLGAVAYVCEGALFSGDTLFAAGCGRMFEGTPEGMQASLAALRALPDDTRLYCGHEYTEQNLRFAANVEPANAAISGRLTRVRGQRAAGQPSLPCTLAEELATNPFLRWDAPDVIARARQLGAANDQPAAVFAALRRAKDSFKA
jgi:hydroxyacylglutathione hydrolase